MSVKKGFSRFLKDQNMKIIPSQIDGSPVMNFNSYQPQDEFKAEIVGGGSLEIQQVEINDTKSGFSYFLDGIERTKVLSYHPVKFVPVIYGYIAAVILCREDKKMKSADIETMEENLYLPFKEDNDSPGNYFDIKDFSKHNFIPSNIGVKNNNGAYPVLPAEFEQKAHSIIQEKRRKMENELARKWLNKKYIDGWLFVDGRLEPLGEDLKSDSKAVGIIKSHQVTYFEPDVQFKIYMMDVGQRSSVFQPIKYNKKQDKLEKENIYSWYLRLYNNKSRGNANFGIIRVEIPAKQELLSMVDTISSWILLERNPIAFPESRWDRMIYPIKYCEDYLKSKAPSWAIIDSMA